MGQYFYIVNTTKKEYLHPHKFDAGLKLLEFGYSSHMMLALTVLLRQSSETGGGDFPFDDRKGRHYKLKNPTVIDIAKVIAKVMNDEGSSPDSVPELVGHWANDNIVVVGDYDESELYQDCDEEYTNISEDIIALLKDHDIYNI